MAAEARRADDDMPPQRHPHAVDIRSGGREDEKNGRQHARRWLRATTISRHPARTRRS